MEIESRLLALAARKFGAEVSSLSIDDDFFERLGINSLQALDLLSELEAEFDVQIPDYELQGVTTFRGLAEKIGERV
jgi:acyl carrier protein